MADGGEGFFKICVSIIPQNYLSESDDDSEEELNYLKPNKRTKYCDSTRMRKLSSVYRIQ